jgi:hypothetical protein
MKYLLAAVLFFAQAQPTVKPLNSTGVATDVNVPPGAHFYFIVAQNAQGYSGPSVRVDCVVPAGTHSVVLQWDPSTESPAPSYYIYRGAPPTGLTGAPK